MSTARIKLQHEYRKNKITASGIAQSRQKPKKWITPHPFFFCNDPFYLVVVRCKRPLYSSTIALPLEERLNRKVSHSSPFIPKVIDIADIEQRAALQLNLPLFATWMLKISINCIVVYSYIIYNKRAVRRYAIIEDDALIRYITLYTNIIHKSWTIIKNNNKQHSSRWYKIPIRWHGQRH